MAFEFDKLLSAAATTKAAPFAGYPPHHLVGGNIDEPTVPAEAAPERGVEIKPGSQWTVDGVSNRTRMRLCFGHPSIENIRAGIARLADICFEEFGPPKRSGNVTRG